MKIENRNVRSIYDDSMWLVNLTENLLSITRIETGPCRCGGTQR